MEYRIHRHCQLSHFVLKQHAMERWHALQNSSSQRESKLYDERPNHSTSTTWTRHLGSTDGAHRARDKSKTRPHSRICAKLKKKALLLSQDIAAMCCQRSSIHPPSFSQSTRTTLVVIATYVEPMLAFTTPLQLDESSHFCAKLLCQKQAICSLCHAVPIHGFCLDMHNQNSTAKHVWQACFCYQKFT